MAIDPSELIPSADAAAMLHVKPFTLTQWRAEGRGPAFIKVGRFCFYRRSDISTWLAAQRRDPAAKSQAAA